MGTHCSCCRNICCAACSNRFCPREKNKLKEGFREKLGIDFLRALPNLNINLQVAMILVKNLDIKAARQSGYNGNENLFVTLQLKDSIDITQNTSRPTQKQRSSHILNTLTPIWRPPEKFLFVFKSLEETEVVMNVNSAVKVKGCEQECVIGEGILSLSQFSMGDKNIKCSVRVRHCENGVDIGYIEVDVCIIPVKEALSYDVQEVYEYQRWHLGKGWCGTHMLPTDPGRFSSVDGAVFGQNIHVVEPLLPTNFCHKDWRIYATDYDPEGWFYARSCRADVWDKDKGSNVVKRRLWTREIYHRDYNFDEDVYRKTFATQVLEIQDDTEATNQSPINFSRRS